MARIKIATKRIHRETENGIVILTSFNNGHFFSIPKSQVKERRDGGIKINDVYTEPCQVLTLSSWIYDILYDDLKKMQSHDYKLLNL